MQITICSVDVILLGNVCLLLRRTITVTTVILFFFLKVPHLSLDSNASYQCH